MENVKLTDVQKNIQDKYLKISEVVRNTKDALIASRTPDGFVDKNYMKEPGIISEASALIGLLLLVEAFYNNAENEEGVVNPVIAEVEKIVDFDKDIENIKDIQKASLELIYGWYEKEGFTAKPLVKRGYEDLFNNEDDSASYIDSLTYVLSATILSRWLDTQKKLVLDAELRELNTKLLIKTLDILLKAQHEDGLWGFRADRDSQSSLFFTYSAGVTLADFFDYILGEIAYTLYPDKDESEQEALVGKFKDTELIAQINDALGGDIEKRVYDTRAKVQDWLLTECLPRMPKIAQCGVATEEQQEAYTNKVGMWKEESKSEYTKYFNLNYSYYLIDLMVVLSTDKRFKEICSNFESTDWSKFDSSCKKILDEQDYKYYFGKTRNDNIASFWIDFMAQTIHSSRAQYMVASRTGTKFWNQAELKVKWNHATFSDECEEIAIDRNNNPILDPAIVPMALRANTNFSYYISLQTDMEVDRLFRDICDELATDSNADTLADLWDKNNYNIQLTERSIEAVVDYYDYLNKYECVQLVDAQQGANNVAVAPTVVTEVAEKSPFERALEEKIAEYLNSEEGQALVKKAVSEQMPELKTVETFTPAASGLPTDEEITNWMESATQLLSQLPDVSDVRDGLLEQMIDLFEKLRIWSFRRAIDESGLDWNANKIALVSRDYEERRKALLKAIGIDVQNDNDHLYDLEELYSELKKLRSN